MTEFKVGDRVRLKEHYGIHKVGTEGIVEYITDGYLLHIDSLYDKCGAIYEHRFELVESRKDSPKVGDTVRVVLEGESTGQYFENMLRFDSEFVKSIEIIKPAKPSVADLPDHSVVRLTDGGLCGLVCVKRPGQGWLSIAGLQTTSEEIDEHGWTLLVEKSNG